MKKLLKHLLLSCAAVTFISCSDDDSNNDNLPESLPLLKSVIYPATNNSDELPVDLSEYYYYNNNGYLIKANGNKFDGEYVYDSNDRLISKTIAGIVEYTYEYDNLGRVTKQLSSSNGDYIQLFYENGKVITHRYFEINNKLEKREFLLDAEGRVIKMTDLDPSVSVTLLDSEEYQYDPNGNIIKIIKQLQNQEPETENYTYLDTKNPYYYSLKKYYEATYYIENYDRLRVYNYKNGLCPNLPILESTDFDINDIGFPLNEHSNDTEEVYCTYTYY